MVAHIELEGLESVRAVTNGEIDNLKQMWNNFVQDVKDVVKELTTQHPEDIKEVKSVDEKQTDPQATDTKWLNGEEVTFNPNETPKDGTDPQVMTTENGMQSTEGRGKDGTYIKEVENTGTAKRDKSNTAGNVKLDTVSTTGNVGPDGAIYNAYYIIQNGKDTIDTRGYVPDEDMPKKK